LEGVAKVFFGISDGVRFPNLILLLLLGLAILFTCD